MKVCNLARLRRGAIHHGREWTSISLDPATVNALLDLAFAARDLYFFEPTDTRWDEDMSALGVIQDRLESAFELFAWSEDEAMSEEAA